MSNHTKYKKIVLSVAIILTISTMFVACASTDALPNKITPTNNKDTIMPEPTIRSIIEGEELKSIDLVSSLEKLFNCDLNKINHIKAYNPNRVQGDKLYSMKDGKYIFYTSMFWSRVDELYATCQPIEKLPKNNNDMCTYWFMKDEEVLFYIFGCTDSDIIYASDDKSSYKIQIEDEKFGYITKYRVEPIVS